MKKKDIEILRVTHLHGPNIWTYRPCIEAWVDIGALEDFPSDLIPGLYERLTALLPSLIEHRCGVGERGGFLQRLREGTYAAHILEHVTLELQNLAGMRTGFGKARETSVRGVYKVAFRTREEQVGRAALAAARDLLMALIEERFFDLPATLVTLRDLVDRRCLGPSTAHIVDAATVRQIPAIRLTDGNLVQLGFGAHQRRIWTAETDQTGAVAESISRDKDLTKSLLSACGVPVPEGRMVTNAEEAWDAAEDIGVPVAVKPYDGNHGRGVSLDLSSKAEIVAAYHLAHRKGGGSVIVEQFVPGNEHRLLVVGDRVVAAAAGEAAWVTGDGTANIIELVDQQINSDPRRGLGEEFPLNTVSPQIAAEIILELERQGLTAYDVLEAGRKALIQRNGNVAFDVTDNVHPEVAAMAVLATRIVGLDVAGIDLVTQDISRPLSQQRGAIIEVNAGPGLLSHLKPASGSPRAVGAAIVDHLFAPHESGRLPIIGVAGSRGTTLIARLVAWLIQIDGKHVGLACSDGLYLDSRQIAPARTPDWESGQRLLINRSVEAAVFENSAHMILSEGLAYDKCEVGVVTDIDGHTALGEFYIDAPDQMFSVLRTQVDVILPSGTAILNAAEPQVVEMASLCDGKVIFYGLDGRLDPIVSHRAVGDRVIFLRDGNVVLAEGAEELTLMTLSSLKANKAAQPESILAAVAAAWALGVSPDLLAAGLTTFELNPRKTHY
ncbi:cyanophycin synthetase [Actimicrobium sp. GrIS 1.19]|uniref:cyanophycin synthetase n=1 Tax=Actimicrobium sp. GrIS 1.19 TaxID=3071708 RepID=UPI002E0C4434|nr:cyanophycin synthetase [Actimicrobium sp. GrIS 1.19]